jgi:hypothetical protein
MKRGLYLKNRDYIIIIITISIIIFSSGCINQEKKEKKDTEDLDIELLEFQKKEISKENGTYLLSAKIENGNGRQYKTRLLEEFHSGWGTSYYRNELSNGNILFNNFSVQDNITLTKNPRPGESVDIRWYVEIVKNNKIIKEFSKSFSIEGMRKSVNGVLLSIFDLNITVSSYGSSFYEYTFNITLKNEGSSLAYRENITLKINIVWDAQSFSWAGQDIESNDKQYMYKDMTTFDRISSYEIEVYYLNTIQDFKKYQLI